VRIRFIVDGVAPLALLWCVGRHFLLVAQTKSFDFKTAVV
jgi:hypothetical protein